MDRRGTRLRPYPPAATMTGMGLGDTRLDIEGLSLHVRIGGARQAPPIVLVHGAAVSSRHMEPLARELQGTFRVIVPDLPGHGQSEGPPEVYGLRQHADMVAGVIRELAGGRAGLVGNSYGCQIITTLAIRHPERAARAVLQGPTLDPVAGHGPRQFARWMINTFREGTTQPSQTFEQWGQAGLRVFAGTMLSMFRDRIEQRLPHVECPTLVVCGTRDAVTPPDWGRRAARMVPGGEFVAVPEATHTMPVAHPEELADVVTPFLAEAE